MTRRFSIILAVVLALTMAFPIIPISVGADDAGSTEPPTRYGFTPELKTVASLGSEAICVDAGDFDARNNDDIVYGANGAVVVYTNNGGSGTSFGMTQYANIPLSGYYIVQVKAVDYDGDSDVDIIALGQDEYALANEAGDGIAATLGNMRLFYLENTGSGFTLETYYDFDDVFYQLSGINPTGAWFWTDGKYDLDVDDVDGDGDVDAMVIYNRDTDSSATTGGENIAISLLTYSGSGLTRTNITSKSTPASWNIGCFIRFADFNLDGYPDIVFAYGGISNNQWLNIKVYAWFHTGSGASWGMETDLDPNGNMEGDGSFPTIPYAIEVGNFAGQDPWDVAVSINDNRNVNPAYCDSQVYIIKKDNPTIDEFGFGGPQAAHSEDYNYQIRGMAAGNLDNAGADDVVAFSKQDDWTDTDPYNAPGEYGLTILAGRSAIPVRFSQLKRFETDVGTLPGSHVIKGVVIGEFDGNTTYDDVAYVGNNIIVGLTTFPPNNPPEKLSVSMNPSPVRNNNETCTINITLKDLDKAGDMDRIEIDFRPMGLMFKTVNAPTGFHDTDINIAYYEFTIQVPSWIPQDDYIVNISMYDGSPDSRDIKSTDTFIFRVKQFNREPLIKLENKTVTVDEDQVTYIENIYDWFMDEDIRDGYDEEPLNITIKTQGGQWLSGVEYFETYKVELVNSTGFYPEYWVLKITPFENFNHELDPFAPDVVTLKATDSGGLESDQLVIRLNIAPVNDLPIIHKQGRPDQNFVYMLEQDDFGYTRVMASDVADETNVKKSHLSFSFIYDDPADEEWLYVDEDKIHWRPTNDQVGPHMVTLLVNDTFDTVEQVMWFNVSNVIDAPGFVSIENSTTKIDLTGGIQGRYLFYVYEHDEFNLTIKASDIDIPIGEQTSIFFQCNLTLDENTYLDVDPEDPTTAYLHFWAEKKYGYAPTYEPDYMPIDTEIIVVDEHSPDVWSVLPIRIRIINVNDPPVFLSISEPTENFVSPILYHIKFSAGSALDPDTDVNDTLVYQWDFDYSNGFQVESNDISGYWNFPNAGTYIVTLRVVDMAGNFLETQVNVTVSGIRDDNDYDNDGMTNIWENEHGFFQYDPSDATVDSDGDGLSNIEEFLNDTDPRAVDTDKDGVKDGEDWNPKDPNYQFPPEDDNSWIEDNFGLFILLLIIVLIIVLVLIGALLFMIVKRNKKKAEDEEERRKLAEEMQKNIYEGQDLYTNLPEAVDQGPQVAPAPEMAALPPQQEDNLDDIFGGAGILPSEPEAAALPAGPEDAPTGEPAPALPPQQQPPEQGATDDLSDLLD